MLLGHGLAVQAFRASNASTGQIGITFNLAPIRAASSDTADEHAARLMDGHQNRWFLDTVLRAAYPSDMLEHFAARADLSFVRDGDLATIAAPIDFLGINYYMRHAVERGGDDTDGPLGINVATRVPDGVATTAMGWGIEPCGLTEILVRVASDYPRLPIYVTENGAAFDDYVDPEGGVDDIERIRFLDGHFRAARVAIQAGVDLRGYFVWSLFDNFEWACGYSKRFGMVFVEYGSQRRIIKQSGLRLEQVIRMNGVPS